MLRGLDVVDDGIIKSGQVNEISVLHYTSSHGQPPDDKLLTPPTLQNKQCISKTQDINMAPPALVLGLRGVQVLFSIMVLGLSAYRTFTPLYPSLSSLTHANTPAVVDASDVSWVTNQTPSLRNSLAFMLFTSLWTLLAVAYLVVSPRRFPAAAHEYAIIAVEFLTMLFWFAAFVAVASNVGTVNYSFWEYTTLYKVAVAAVVFSALVWLTFVVTAALAAMHIRRGSRNDKAARSMTGV
jgi:hypothetical protein